MMIEVTDGSFLQQLQLQLIEEITCNDNALSFYNDSALVDKLLERHNHICYTCGMIFQSNVSLTLHKDTHQSHNRVTSGYVTFKSTKL